MRIQLSLAVIALWAIGGPARGDVDPDALARFEAEYPAASKQLEDLFRQVKGSCFLWTGARGESKPTHANEASFALDHAYEKVSIKSERGRGVGESLYCVNPDQVIYLTRLPGTKTFRVAGDGSTALDRSAYVTSFGRFVKAHFASFGQPLSRIMSRPGVRVVGAQFVDKAGRPADADEHPLIKIEFEDGTKARKSNTSVTFDPSAGWVVRSSEFRMDGTLQPMRITTDVEYGAFREGVLLPRRVTCRDAGGEASICEFRDWSFEPTPLQEFKPAHYGISNLVAKPGATGGLLPYWLGGLGASTFAAAALMLRWRGTRIRPQLA